MNMLRGRQVPEPYAALIQSWKDGKTNRKDAGTAQKVIYRG